MKGLKAASKGYHRISLEKLKKENKTLSYTVTSKIDEMRVLEIWQIKDIKL
jgi:hypothetical protein